MSRIICEKCRAKDIYLQVPMIETKREEISDTCLYKFTFQCVRCFDVLERTGMICFNCGGTGYHCHIHYGTDCEFCHGTGIIFCDNERAEWLRRILKNVVG